MRVVLGALRRKRGLSLRELARLCREEPGGEGIGTTQLSAYLTGKRSIGDTHFLILCRLLRIKPPLVLVARYLLGRPNEVGE